MWLQNDIVGDGTKASSRLGWGAVQYAATCHRSSLCSVITSCSSRTRGIGTDQPGVRQLVSRRRRLPSHGRHGRVQRLPCPRRHPRWRVSSAECRVGWQLDSEVSSDIQLLTTSAAVLSSCYCCIVSKRPHWPRLYWAFILLGCTHTQEQSPATYKSSLTFPFELLSSDC